VVRNPGEEEERVRVVNTLFLITNNAVLIDRWDNCVDPAKKRRRKMRFFALIFITPHLFVSPSHLSKDNSI